MNSHTINHYTTQETKHRKNRAVMTIDLLCKKAKAGKKLIKRTIKGI